MPYESGKDDDGRRVDGLSGFFSVFTYTVEKVGV